MEVICDENKKQRLNAAVKHLISIGLIDGKYKVKNIAQTMNRNSQNISSTLRGDVRYLNQKFVQDFCATYKNIISEDWLWEGVGEMLTNGKLVNTNNIVITDETLTSLSKEDLIVFVKQLMALHSEQTAMYQMLIRQNDQMISNGQDRFNNITNIMCSKYKISTAGDTE